jgi:hypothetical protein
MAAVTTFTATAADNLTFNQGGRKAFTQIYEATSIPALKSGALEQRVCYASITGAMTINAATVLGNLRQWDKVIFIFTGDATGRTVTFGTGFSFSAATLVLAASSKDGRVEFEFDGTVLREVSRYTQA